MTTHHERKFPVILITGTPGTGKSFHSLLLSQSLQTTSTPLVHLNIGEIVKEKGFHEGWDEEWQSWTIDEDRLLDYLEEVINPESGPAETGMFVSRRCDAELMSGFIIDHHDPSLFPERWIDLAVVLTCDNTVLHERLTERNYPENKLTENITAEIMQTCLSETRESYAEEIIVELGSNGEGEDVDENVRRLESWVASWVSDRQQGNGD